MYKLTYDQPREVAEEEDDDEEQREDLIPQVLFACGRVGDIQKEIPMKKA